MLAVSRIKEMFSKAALRGIGFDRKHRSMNLMINLGAMGRFCSRSMKLPRVDSFITRSTQRFDPTGSSDRVCVSVGDAGGVEQRSDKACESWSQVWYLSP
jgi:hypothetical protein